MSLTDTPRTPDAVRQEAHAHFAFLETRPHLLGLSEGETKEEARLGRLLVDAAIALQENQLLDLSGWFEAHAPYDEGKRLALNVLPFITGPLRLLQMEFTHAALDKLPIAEVRALLEEQEPRVYRGVQLTRDTVHVQYRRLPL